MHLSDPSYCILLAKRYTCVNVVPYCRCSCWLLAWCPRCCEEIPRCYHESATGAAMSQRAVDLQPTAPSSHRAVICGAVMVNGTPLQLVMELMQGSVSDLMGAAHISSHYLSFREQIDVAIGSTAGIAYMHRLQPKPYIHSDIRSNNVMVTRDMMAKVGDLGASHVIESSLSIGPLSIEYLAPERMPGQSGTSTRSTCQSDVYSLGVYLTELFIGCPPIPADRNSRLEQIENDAMMDLCTLMTSDDPSQRPSVQDCFSRIERQKEMSEYKMLPGRRMVKGHLDGQEKMSLIDHVYV